MNVLYNSENYYLVEFPGRGGIELVDKASGRGGFLEGAVEMKLRAMMAGLENAEVDEFLGHYEALLTTPMSVH
jgi:hypothetical protein